MSLERSHVSTFVALAAGVTLGWVLASIPRPTLPPREATAGAI